MAFPATRLRRLRRTGALREMVRETTLRPADLIQPLFVRAGEGPGEPVASMPGVERLSISALVEEAGAVHAAGVPAVILFGIPAAKDEAGSGAYDDEGIVQMAIRALKEAHPGPRRDRRHLPLRVHLARPLRRASRRRRRQRPLARADRPHGALAGRRPGPTPSRPSDMMDGRVAAIRAALDGEGLSATPILSYAVKYASAFYGPFREAAGSTPSEGDRRGYQMDPANGREAMREALADLEEGADMLMVKPAVPYLDVLARLRDRTDAPLAAYHVSGEYSMLKAAAANGWIDERAAALESLTAIKRAGADLIVTYYAKEAAEWLTSEHEATEEVPQSKARSRKDGAAIPLDEPTSG